MENENWYWDRRMLNSIKFSLGVLSLICGIVLISTAFYQFKDELLEFDGGGPPYPELKSVFDPEPEIFHPEIFIPGGIILLILGLVLLLILRLQITGTKNKQLDYLSICLMGWILFFIVIFIAGNIMVHFYSGRYEVLNPTFLMIGAFTSICISISILFYVNKITNKERITSGNFNPPRKLLDYRVLDYGFVLIFLLGICLASFYMVPALSHNTEPTHYHIYWENGRDPEKVVLPGMTASYHLVVETSGGTTSFKVHIIEINRKGNWSVSSEELIVKPNEKKIINFTNYVSPDATEDEYYFRFWVVYSNIFETELVQTYATLDMDWYNSSQTTNPSFFALNSSGTISSHSDEPIVGQLVLITFIVLIVITVLFLKNKKRSQVGNEQ